MHFLISKLKTITYGSVAGMGFSRFSAHRRCSGGGTGKGVLVHISMYVTHGFGFLDDGDGGYFFIRRMISVVRVVEIGVIYFGS